MKVTIWPANIDSTKTVKEGRKFPKQCSKHSNLEISKRHLNWASTLKWKRISPILNLESSEG